jgi:hypothetical protein
MLMRENLTFQRNIFPPSSWLKSKKNKKQETSRSRLQAELSDTKDVDNIMYQNAGLSLNYSVLQHRVLALHSPQGENINSNM